MLKASLICSNLVSILDQLLSVKVFTLRECFVRPCHGVKMLNTLFGPFELLLIIQSILLRMLEMTSIPLDQWFKILVQLVRPFSAFVIPTLILLLLALTLPDLNILRVRLINSFPLWLFIYLFLIKGWLFLSKLFEVLIIAFHLITIVWDLCGRKRFLAVSLSIFGKGFWSD